MKHIIYKTITIGKIKDYRKALKERNAYVSPYAEDLLEKMPESKEQELVLVKTTPGEMGLSGYPTTKEIFDKAEELGLSLCPAEAGPALLLELQDDSWMWIAMEPITDRGGGPGVFDLDRGGAGLGLRADSARPAGGWDSDGGLVFCLRKENSVPSSPLESSELSPLETLTLERAIQVCKEAGYLVFNPL